VSPSHFSAAPGGSADYPSADLAALNQTSERFRLFVENSPDLIVEATREGVILYVTPNVPSILGHTASELQRTNLFAHVHPEELIQMKTLFALPGGRGTCRFRHKNGSWRWFETTGRECLISTEPVRGALVMREITERKEAESMRRHLESELRKSANLSALGLLAGGIAHDFNNVLTAICVHVNIAQKATQEPNVLASLAHVGHAVERAKHLAQEIVRFSQREADERQLVRLPAVAAEVLQLLRPTWPAGVEIVTDLPAHEGWILAIPIQLHQVLTNLFVNAIHAMETGWGRLEVRVESLVVEEPYTEPYPDLGRGRYVQLSVSDTGHGMDAATQQKIFEPFFTTKRPENGTGLGLAVVRNILKNHGASIQVFSVVGRGTTFQLIFAAEPSPKPDQERV